MFDIPPPMIDAYLERAQAETNKQPEVAFEDLHNVCFEWFLVQARSGEDLSALDEVLDQMRGELFHAATLNGTFDAMGATNAEARKHCFAKILAEHEGYQALLTRQRQLRGINHTAEANYGRYSRMFRALEKKKEQDIVQTRVDALSEAVALLPIP